MPFQVFEEPAKSILSRTSGFIAEAGFTHSLTPARNCTYGCSYCYVPTMGIYGGLKPGDSTHWGQATTFKSNAAGLLGKHLRGGERIYCSPLVDPYQPAEDARELMPGILDVLIERPPRVFTVQTRGPLIVRDIPRLRRLAERCTVRVSFSITTDCDEIQRLYEPHCASLTERLAAVAALRSAGIQTFAALAPLLPCHPEELARIALGATEEDILADALHVRAVKARGATTRDAAVQISARHGYSDWLDPHFQADVLARISATVQSAGRRFASGPEGFAWLSK